MRRLLNSSSNHELGVVSLISKTIIFDFTISVLYKDCDACVFAKLNPMLVEASLGARVFFDVALPNEGRSLSLTHIMSYIS